MVPALPRELVVLAIGVVIALLRTPHFVAVEDHGHALRKRERGHEVAHLPRPQLADTLILRRPFHPTVPAAVVVVAVAVLFAVRLVVLLVVRNKVPQGEAVMCRYEVDAG